MVVTTSRNTVNTKDELFFKAMGARIASARKVQRLTQQQLADQLGISQQTLAHYEVGRLRVPASMLPDLAQILTITVDELLGQGKPKEPKGKRGPAPRLQQQIDRIRELPKMKQQAVMEVLDMVLASQTAHQAVS